jgi:hypothetical protein
MNLRKELLTISSCSCYSSYIPYMLVKKERNKMLVGVILGVVALSYVGTCVLNFQKLDRLEKESESTISKP